jgi:serine/threonine protein kinase
MPTKKTENNRTDSLPGHAQILAEKGPHTKHAVILLHRLITGNSLLVRVPLPYQILQEAFDEGWRDKETAEVLSQVTARYQQQQKVDVHALKRWLKVHKNDPSAVIDCLQLDPPEQISIIQVLSRAGSQKLVFLANWEFAQREVVLKSFIGDAKRLIHRELQPHPLSMEHPNIIETHFLKNNNGEIFLIERRLPVVLGDEWASHGIHEAANLLRDVASALAFLQERHLVHGDIKPDNIGFEDGNYILLDFGICRPLEKFAEDSTPTGSLRTRAPEILVGEKPHTLAADIWSLGATVYNSMVGRFPLFKTGEVPPRVSNAEKRESFEVDLARRVRDEWATLVDLTCVPDPLRDPLSKALERDPDKRLEAAALVKLVQRELAAFVRVPIGARRFSPSEELQQLSAYLPDKSVLALMPHSQKHDLKRQLGNLKSAKGLSAQQKQEIDDLLALVA